MSNLLAGKLRCSECGQYFKVAGGALTKHQMHCANRREDEQSREVPPPRSNSRAEKENSAPLPSRGVLEEQNRALQQKISSLEGILAATQESQLHQAEKEKGRVVSPEEALKAEEEEEKNKDSVRKQKSFAFCAMPWLMATAIDLAKTKLPEDYDAKSRIVLTTDGIDEEDLLESRIALSVWEAKNYCIDCPNAAFYKSVRNITCLSDRADKLEAL
jgi:hypothetical protein